MRRSRRNGQIRRTCSPCVQIQRRAQDLGRRGSGLGQDFALRAGDEAAAPETNARAVRRGIGFMADAVAGQHGHPVGHGMGALDGDPRIALAGLLIGGIVRIPADGGGVEQQFRAGQGHEPRRFRVPLIPAHQHAEPTDGRIDGGESQIARGEIKLFIEPGSSGMCILR